MNKRAIAILGAIFILIVGSLGFLIYQRSKSSKSTPAPTDTVNVSDQPTTEAPPEQPANSGAKAVRLTDDPVISPVLFYQGNGISYFNSQGQLFQTDLQITDGNALLSNKRELAIALKPNVSRIIWPQVGNGFIAEFNSGGKKTWSVYDSDKAGYTDIPPQVYSLDWLPSGDKIMYVWVDESGKATLNISNPDTSGYQNVTYFYEPDNVIAVSPDGQTVLFYRTQTQDLTTNAITSVSADGKTFKSVVKDGYNKGVKWSPDSKKFLFTKRDPSSSKFMLWVADISTGEVRNLGIATSESKAVWTKDGQSIVVSVPTTGTAGDGLTQDTIYQMNVTSLDKQEFAPGVAVDAEDLFLSSDGAALFFRNGQDNALYYMSLK